MIRFFDIFLSLFGLFTCFPIFILVYLASLLENRNPLLFQERVGHFQKPFVLIKFRTMRANTQWASTHLINTSAITKVGKFLRKTKLDELPQLWNVLKGDMSLVGPRPCLLNQEEVINARKAKNVFEARPGITGLAQITGIDMSKPELLADTDARMISQLNFFTYLKLIFLTLVRSMVK